MDIAVRNSKRLQYDIRRWHEPTTSTRKRGAHFSLRRFGQSHTRPVSTTFFLNGEPEAKRPSVWRKKRKKRRKKRNETKQSTKHEKKHTQKQKNIFFFFFFKEQKRREKKSANPQHQLYKHSMNERL